MVKKRSELTGSEEERKEKQIKETGQRAADTRTGTEEVTWSLTQQQGGGGGGGGGGVRQLLLSQLLPPSGRRRVLLLLGLHVHARHVHARASPRVSLHVASAQASGSGQSLEFRGRSQRERAPLTQRLSRVRARLVDARSSVHVCAGFLREMAALPPRLADGCAEQLRRSHCGCATPSC